MQLGCMSGHGTTNAIFALRQLQLIFIAANNLCPAFVDFEKVFNDVPRDVICWAPRKQDVEGWVQFKFFVKGQKFCQGKQGWNIGSKREPRGLRVNLDE